MPKQTENQMSEWWTVLDNTLKVYHYYAKGLFAMKVKKSDVGILDNFR